MLSIKNRSEYYTVFFANLLFYVSLAITTFENSSYIESGIGTNAVGILYAISAICSIVLLSKSGRALAKRGNRNFFLTYGIIHAISLFTLALPFSLFLHCIALITYLFSGNILIFSLDIFFEHVDKGENKGKNRGIFLLLGNCGWVIGPLLAALAMDKFSYRGVYALSLFIFGILALVLMYGLRKYKDAKYTPHKVRNALHAAFKKKTLRAAITANFLLQFFFAWMVVYTPIYMYQELHISWNVISLIFAIMLTAFVICDYPLGRLADWLGSEKELAAIGFIIMALCVFSIALLPTQTVFGIGIILFFSRVGAATVEAMTEIHFFKLVKDSDPSLLSVFRDLRPIAYMTAPLLAIISLSILQFKMIFAVLGIVMILGFIISLQLENKSKWWVRAHRS